MAKVVGTFEEYRETFEQSQEFTRQREKELKLPPHYLKAPGVTYVKGEKKQHNNDICKCEDGQNNKTKYKNCCKFK